VYGEKSILATEVKELQTRLLGLSDEIDKSISVLDEVCSYIRFPSAKMTKIDLDPPSSFSLATSAFNDSKYFYF